MLIYAVVVIKRRLRAPAYKHCAGDVFVREIKDFLKFRPIFDVGERQGFDGRARNYHTVELHFFNFVKVFVKLVEISFASMACLVRRRFDKRDVHLQRRITKQPQQLRFGNFLCGHKVQNCDFNGANVLRHGAAAVHDENLFVKQTVECRKVARDNDRHITSPPFQAPDGYPQSGRLRFQAPGLRG